MIEIIAGLLGGEIETLVTREPATAEHHHTIHQTIENFRRFAVGANALFKTPPRFWRDAILAHHAIESLGTFRIATGYALPILASHSILTPTAASATAIATTLLIPAARLTLHAHLIEITTAFFQGKIKALIEGQPDATEIHHAPVEFLSQVRNLFALRALL